MSERRERYANTARCFSKRMTQTVTCWLTPQDTWEDVLRPGFFKEITHMLGHGAMIEVHNPDYTIDAHLRVVEYDKDKKIVKVCPFTVRTFGAFAPDPDIVAGAQAVAEKLPDEVFGESQAAETPKPKPKRKAPA